MALLNITDPTIRQPPPGQVRPYPSPTSTGKIPFHIKSHNIAAETWYALYGTLDDDDDDDDDTTTTPAANGRAPPLIVLHGGPGATHHYLKPLALLSQGGPHGAAGRPVLLYDQIGCGHSTRLRAHRGDNTLWQPQLFLDELTNLVTHLGLRQFDLLGQSWGGMLVAQYAAMARPPGLRRLVLANCPADMDTWVAVANELGGLLPEETQRTLRRLEEEEREGEGEKGSCGIASEEYEKAMLPFYQWFVCRLEPMAPEFVETMKNLKEDDTAYHTMVSCWGAPLNYPYLSPALIAKASLGKYLGGDLGTDTATRLAHPSSM